ncbi:MAG TPA: methyltransferase domain-containing protein [Dongiaceae bacterium]|jgi:SAM-dependent methyltransferase|nr:methyltransferase domain-containing protein [Dongiaceae bacterium]
MNAKSGGDTYYLATGAAGAKRLALLEEVYGPDAARIMRDIGIPKGGRVADLGCGTGNTLRWFAGQVGDAGDVTGVDLSAEQLAIAKAQAEAAGHRNIRLVEASIYETGLPRAAFDVVHCRFVLCHLARPMDALREIAALARPGGLVIVFDVDIEGLYSVPPTAAYARVRELVIARTGLRGSDCRLGLKLPQMFLEAGFPAPETAIVHPIYLRGERKRLWEYSFLEAGPYMLEKGLCTQAELDALAADLAAVAADETIAIAQATMPATWARKPV